MNFGFCEQTIGIWQTFGYIYVIYKIAIPIILIAICITTLGKSILTSDEKEIKKNYNMMFKKIILAILIFFVPAIVKGVFSLLDEFTDIKRDYAVCETCIRRPKGKACEQKVLAMRDDA